MWEISHSSPTESNRMGNTTLAVAPPEARHLPSSLRVRWRPAFPTPCYSSLICVVGSKAHRQARWPARPAVLWDFPSFSNKSPGTPCLVTLWAGCNLGKSGQERKSGIPAAWGLRHGVRQDLGPATWGSACAASFTEQSCTSIYSGPRCTLTTRGSTVGKTQ